MAAGTFSPRNVAGHRRPVTPIRGLLTVQYYGHHPPCAVLAASFGCKPLMSRRRIMAPPLADLTSHDTYVQGLPHDTLAYLRAHDPVHWTEESDGGRGFWSLTKYDDVLFASSSAESTS